MSDQVQAPSVIELLESRRLLSGTLVVGQATDVNAADDTEVITCDITSTDEVVDPSIAVDETATDGTTEIDNTSDGSVDDTSDQGNVSDEVDVTDGGDVTDEIDPTDDPEAVKRTLDDPATDEQDTSGQDNSTADGEVVTMDGTDGVATVDDPMHQIMELDTVNGIYTLQGNVDGYQWTYPDGATVSVTDAEIMPAGSMVIPGITPGTNPETDPSTVDPSVPPVAIKFSSNGITVGQLNLPGDASADALITAAESMGSSSNLFVAVGNGFQNLNVKVQAKGDGHITVTDADGKVIASRGDAAQAPVVVSAPADSAAAVVDSVRTEPRITVATTADITTLTIASSGVNFAAAKGVVSVSTEPAAETQPATQQDQAQPAQPQPEQSQPATPTDSAPAPATTPAPATEPQQQPPAPKPADVVPTPPTVMRMQLPKLTPTFADVAITPHRADQPQESHEAQASLAWPVVLLAFASRPIARQTRSKRRQARD